MPFGGTLTLYCGDSDLTISPGNWYHDGEPLGVYSRIYTIRNATFDDDGKYQCIVNGSGALSSPFQVDVYGKSYCTYAPHYHLLECTKYSAVSVVL